MQVFIYFFRKLATTPKDRGVSANRVFGLTRDCSAVLNCASILRVRVEFVTFLTENTRTEEEDGHFTGWDACLPKALTARARCAAGGLEFIMKIMTFLSKHLNKRPEDW